MLNIITGTTDEGDPWVSIETPEGGVIVHALMVSASRVGCGRVCVVYEGWKLTTGEIVRGSISCLLAHALRGHWRTAA